MHGEVFTNIKVLIKVNRINRIVGTLEKFIVYTKDFNLVCGKNFEIYPPNCSVAEKINTKDKNFYNNLIKNLAKSKEWMDLAELR